MRPALPLLALAACPIPEFTHPDARPRIERFEAAPFEVDRGAAVTLRWKVIGADRIDVAGVPGEAEGSRPVEVETSTTFVLVAENAAGTAEARSSVEVRERRPVRIERFEVTPTLVEAGDPVRITWDTEGATRVVLRLGTGEVLEERAPQGGTRVLRPEGDVAVELWAEGWPAPVLERRTVRTRPGVPSIEDFFADPPIASAGDIIGLHWRVRRADRVRVSDGAGILFEGFVSSDIGYLSAIALPGPRRFELFAEGEGGTASEIADAFVLDDPPVEIVRFTATPTITGPGGDVEVEWIVSGASQVDVRRIGAGPIAVSEPAGRYVHRGAVEGLVGFEVLASRGDLLERRAVEVLVTGLLPAIRAFDAPRAARPGEQVTVSFEVEGADSSLLSTDTGTDLLATTASAASVEVGVAATVGLVLTATNRSGTTVASRIVGVAPPVEVLRFQATSTIARLDRPIELEWETSGATSAFVVLGIGATAPPSGSTSFLAPWLGPVEASLTAVGPFESVTATIGLEVLPPTYGDDEPNDESSTAAGTFFSFPWTIDGVLEGDDADVFIVQPSIDRRVTLATAPIGGCQAGVAVDVFEIDPILGPLSPRITDDRGPACASIDGTQTASLEPPYAIRVRRPTGEPAGSPTPYRLFLSARDGFCPDGITDLTEACDDAGVVAGDGCDGCMLEGLTEVEPNDVPSLATVVSSPPISGFLGYGDRDIFAVTIGTAGPHTVSLGPPSCALDARLALFDASGTRLAESDNGGLGCAELSGPALILAPGFYLLEVARGGGLFLPRKGAYLVDVR
jgi:hypothetical protein